MDEVFVTLSLAKTGQANREVRQRVYDVHDDLSASAKAAEALLEWLTNGWCVDRVLRVEGFKHAEVDT